MARVGRSLVKIAPTGKEDARKLVAPPCEKVAWKTVRAACATPRKVIDAWVYSYFEHVTEMEKLLAENH